MEESESEKLEFEATRQYVVYPDQKFNIESRNGGLFFTNIGSQFDSTWIVRGARGVLGDKIANRMERMSPKIMLILGIGTSCISLLLLFFLGAFVAKTASTVKRKSGTAIGFLVLVFIVGLVMTIAGFFSMGKKSSAKNFALRLSQIAKSKLLPTQSELARHGEPQVARIEITLKQGKPVILSIATDSDLEKAKSILKI